MHYIFLRWPNNENISYDVTPLCSPTWCECSLSLPLGFRELSISHAMDAYSSQSHLDSHFTKPSAQSSVIPASGIYSYNGLYTYLNCICIWAKSLNIFIPCFLPCQQSDATCNKRRLESESSPQQKKKTRSSPDGSSERSSDMDIESGKCSTRLRFPAGS